MDEQRALKPRMIDLNPILQRRKQQQCGHDEVLLDASEADLECRACGKQVNPYWFLAKMMDQWDEFSKKILQHETEMMRRHEQNVRLLNHQAERLCAEIETLETKKRQLLSEQIAGASLGQHAKRWKRARTRK